MFMRRAVPGIAFVVVVFLAGPCMADDGGLPFFKSMATDRGVELPPPFGLSVVYSDTKENLELSNLTISNSSGTRSGDFISLDNSKLKSSTVLAKGDLWLFPFLDLFGFVGSASNKVDGDATFTTGDAVTASGSTACSNPTTVRAMQDCAKVVTESFDKDSDALQYGGGGTFAMGFGHAFALVSAVYATSESSDNGTKIHSFTASPRVGWRFPVSQFSTVAVYGGASYLSSKVDIKGQTDVAVGAQSVPVDYQVSQKNDHNWSYLGGVNWDITRHWSLLAEGSGGAREGFLGSASWHFGG